MLIVMLVFFGIVVMLVFFSLSELELLKRI